MTGRRERERLGRGWGRDAVPRRILLSLLAGRLAYRGTTALLPVALLAVWGPDRFGPYASLFGTWLFLNPMLSWGLEKAALLLLPRTRTGRPYVLGALITFGVALALPAVVGFVLLALVSDSPVAALGAVLALLNVAQGMNQALVGYQRALGRPLVDTANYLTAGALNVAAVALAAWTGLTPLGFGLALLAGTAALDLAHTVALATRARLGARLLARRRLVRHAAGTAFFMGLNIILVTVTTSALFVVLAWHGLERESAYLYVAISIFNVVHAALDYLLRVYQPSVALLLRRARAVEVRRGVARWSWRLLASAAACLVVPLPLYEPAQALTGSLPGYALPTAYLALCLPVLLAPDLLGYALENLDFSSLVVSSAGPVAALLVTVAVALVAVPAFGGAFGAVYAFAAGKAGQSAVTAVLLGAWPATAKGAAAHGTP
jgi:hypothetical protein